MELFLIFIVLPFLFSLAFVFIIFLRSASSLYVPFVLALCALVAVFASSFSQVCISSTTWMKTLEMAPSIFFNSFIYSAFVEEFFKMLCFYLIFSIIPSLSKYKDSLCKANSSIKDKEYIINATLFAMFFCATFAGFENVAYFSNEANIASKRLFSASLLHILLSPFYVGLLSKRCFNLFFSFVLSVSLHGCYNFFILQNMMSFSIFIIVFLLLFNIICFYRVQNFKINVC